MLDSSLYGILLPFLLFQSLRRLIEVDIISRSHSRFLALASSTFPSLFSPSPKRYTSRLTVSSDPHFVSINYRKSQQWIQSTKFVPLLILIEAVLSRSIPTLILRTLQIVDSTKDLLNSLSPASASTQEETTTNSDLEASSTVGRTPSDDLLGTTTSDSGDAPLSGDIERQSGTNDNSSGGNYLPYSATGRDATGSFDGGANEEIPNLGAGELPGKQ
ncbi:hypothetical protein JCM3765_003830 [Sporobolomyces pararoseus]